MRVKAWEVPEDVTFDQMFGVVRGKNRKLVASNLIYRSAVLESIIIEQLVSAWCGGRRKDTGMELLRQKVRFFNTYASYNK